MTERPDSLPRHPAPAAVAAPIRDPLSDVLRTVRLRGAVFFMLDVSTPWTAAMPDGETLAPIAVPQSQQVISFHVITRGSCWGGLPDDPSHHLETGDVIVFPRGDGYFMPSETL